MTIGKVAKLFGLSVQTIRRYEKKGALKSIRSAGNHRLFSVDEIRKLIEETQPKKAVLYARVSSTKQKKDGNLNRQIERLKDYAEKNEYEIINIFQEQTSGINENRKQLKKLIDMAEKKEFTTLIIEYPDRLARFGYHYLENLFRICGVEIISTQQKESRSSEEELTEDLLIIMTDFSDCMYGKRSQAFKQKIKKSMEEMEGKPSGE